MSYGDRAGTEAIFARSDEFDAKAVSEIRDPFYVECYVEAREIGRFDMDTILHVEMLTWNKGEDICFLQTFNGTMTMKDIRCFARGIEENQCVALDFLTKDAVQYAVVRTVESIRGLGNVNVGIFGVNTCGLDDPTEEVINRGLEEIRDLITADDLMDPDIFSKEFLLFPIHRAYEASCVVVLNPEALLERNERSTGKECNYIEIGTKNHLNADIKEHIGMILDSHRIHQQRGPFRRAILDGVPYHNYRNVGIPPLPVEEEHNEAFQLLFVIKNLLENGANIQDYLRKEVEQLGKKSYEMLKDVKNIRRNVLSQISLDVHRNGSEYQRYLHQRRIEELEEQERTRSELIEKQTGTERSVRNEWDLHYPSTDVIDENGIVATNI